MQTGSDRPICDLADELYMPQRLVEMALENSDIGDVVLGTHEIYVRELRGAMAEYQHLLAFAWRQNSLGSPMYEALLDLGPLGRTQLLVELNERLGEKPQFASVRKGA